MAVSKTVTRDVRADRYLVSIHCLGFLISANVPNSRIPPSQGITVRHSLGTCEHIKSQSQSCNSQRALNYLKLAQIRAIPPE